MEIRHLCYYQKQRAGARCLFRSASMFENVTAQQFFKDTELKHYLYYNALTVSGSIHQVSGAVDSGGVTCHSAGVRNKSCFTVGDLLQSIRIVEQNHV